MIFCPYFPYLLNILVKFDTGDHIMALSKFVKNTGGQTHRCVNAWVAKTKSEPCEKM